MKPQYEPKTVQQALGYLAEEAGEVMAAVGKTWRWGLESVNPELPPDEQESNRDWILRELVDLEGAIVRVKHFLLEHAAAESKAMRRAAIQREFMSQSGEPGDDLCRSALAERHGWDPKELWPGDES